VTTYRIISAAGADMGIFEADSQAGAILAMHREAGYGPSAVRLVDGMLVAGPSWDEVFGPVDLRDEGGRVEAVSAAA
jgi:hypothetical protein